MEKMRGRRKKGGRRRRKLRGRPLRSETWERR
jgi:hypothetical protein